MKDIPNAADARLAAKAAADATKLLSPVVIEQINTAINNGSFSTVLEGIQVGNWQHTKDALRERGYIVTTERTGHNETGLKVNWGMTDAEQTEAYYNK